MTSSPSAPSSRSLDSGELGGVIIAAIAGTFICTVIAWLVAKRLHRQRHPRLNTPTSEDGQGAHHRVQGYEKPELDTTEPTSRVDVVAFELPSSPCIPNELEAKQVQSELPLRSGSTKDTPTCQHSRADITSSFPGSAEDPERLTNTRIISHVEESDDSPVIAADPTADDLETRKMDVVSPVTSDGT
jgi:hypothetical protein